MKVKKYSLLIIIAIFAITLMSCSNPLFETESELNSVFNDGFTYISRNKIEKGLYKTVYFSEKLQKNISVLSKGNQSLTTHYSNYDALKYDEESKNKLSKKLEEELFLKNTTENKEYEISFDNEFYTLAYEDYIFDMFWYTRHLWKEGDSGTEPDVINNETISITIKESAVTIDKAKYVTAVRKSLEEINLSSKFKVTFVKENGEKVDEYEFKN